MNQAAPTPPASLSRKHRLLRDLFCAAEPQRRVAVWIDHPAIPQPLTARGGDLVTATEAEVGAMVDWHVADYESRARWHESVGDDGVPVAKLHTGTHVFASAFGCAVEEFPNSVAAARPGVFTADEADRLDLPSLEHPVFERIHRVAEAIRRRLGPDAPISVPDLQSPFDIAAIIWDKESFFVALYESPEAVHRLVEKCRRLLAGFVEQFLARHGEVSTGHCPNLWLPPEVGLGLSEDECGSISKAQFEEFCLPSLVELSDRFGGLHLHCCAAADHQYPQFNRIPALRGLNRVFQSPGPEPAIRAFRGGTVLAQAWLDEKFALRMLAAAYPESRFLFNMPHLALDEARGLVERLRAAADRLPVA